MSEPAPVKPHRAPQAGRKFDKKKTRSLEKRGIDSTKTNQAHQNHRAFGVNSAARAQKAQRRNLDVDLKRQHLPVTSHVGTSQNVSGAVQQDLPPFLIAVIGPANTGKSTLIASLVKHYTNHSIPLAQLAGPITVLTGPQRRITIIECPPSLHAMIDLCKIADLVLLTVDASFGFEMETFECLNILKQHGFPKVMGVLTHLDKFRTMKQLKTVKKTLKHRFWTEICDGAKLFYLSGLINGKYMKREVSNLARFISVMKFRPLSWRNQHAYVCADRMEDLTEPAAIQANRNVDRRIALYGYVRGTLLHSGPSSLLHFMGVGDFVPHSMTVLADPVPVIHRNKGGEAKSRRKLNEKERRLYAPLSDVGDVIYDQDVVYIQMKDKHVHYTAESQLVRSGAEGEETPEERAARIALEEKRFGEGVTLVKSMQDISQSVDEKLKQSGLQLFKGSVPIIGDDMEAAIQKINEGDDGNDSDTEQTANQSSSSSGESNIRSKMMMDSQGRMRRRVLFDGESEDVGMLADSTDDGTDVADDDEQDEEDEDEEMDGEEGFSADEEEASEGRNLDWKNGIIDRAAERFQKTVSLMDLVYGADAAGKANQQRAEETQAAHKAQKKKFTLLDDDDAADSDLNDDDFFRPRKVRDVTVNDMDSLVATVARDEQREGLPQWEGEEDFDNLKQSRFVTGDWSEEQDRAADPNLLQKQVDSDEEEASKKQHRKDRKNRRRQANDRTGGQQDGDDEDDDDVDMDDDEDEQADRITVEGNQDGDAESRLSAKAALKQAFDAGYDTSKTKEPVGEGEEEENILDNLHKAAADQSSLNASAFSALDEETRMRLEGIRPGQYVRIVLDNVPCEFIHHFSAKQPLVLGAVLTNESNLGFLTMRLKKHRWHQRILKSHDPLIFSSGWRRWQSCPIFAVEDPNQRLRFLKYTPENMHCLAVTYGFMAPQGSGLVAYQYTHTNFNGFRIAATATMLELNQSITPQNQVVKKLKLIGHPFKIFKNTAFIRDMFTSSVEVQKFIGAKIRTVSGIRGAIKKAAHGEGHDGVFRATFEDKILTSDIVFCRSWTQVPVIPYAQTVHSLLFADGKWQGLRTMKQIRIDDSIPAVNRLSGYDPSITKDNREVKHFHPLRIPASLQSELPFAIKPKEEKAKARPHEGKKKYLVARQLEVRSDYEKQMKTFMQQVSTVKAVKDEKRKASGVRQRENFLKKIENEKAKHADQNKELRKRKYIAEAQGRIVKQKRFTDK